MESRFCKKRSFVSSVGVIGTMLFYSILNSGNGNDRDFVKEEVNPGNFIRDLSSSKTLNLVKNTIVSINEESENFNNKEMHESSININTMHESSININTIHESSNKDHVQAPKPAIRRNRRKRLSISTQDSGYDTPDESINEELNFTIRLKNHLLFSELQSSEWDDSWIIRELINLKNEYENSILNTINIEKSSSTELLLLIVEGLYKELFKGLRSIFNNGINDNNGNNTIDNNNEDNNNNDNNNIDNNNIDNNNIDNNNIDNNTIDNDNIDNNNIDNNNIVINEDVVCTGYLIDDIINESLKNNFTIYYRKLNKLYDFINYEKKLPEYEFYCGMVFIFNMHNILEMRKHRNVGEILKAYNSLYLYMAEKRFKKEGLMLFPDCKYFINMQKRFEIPHHLLEINLKEEIDRNYYNLDIFLGLYKVPIIMNQYSITKNDDCKEFFTKNLNFILDRIYKLNNNSVYLQKVEEFVMNIAENCIFN